MCTGAILLYKIPRVVIGENANFKGGEDLLRSHGVEVVVLDDSECKQLMRQFIVRQPQVSRAEFCALRPTDVFVGLVRRHRRSGALAYMPRLYLYHPIFSHNL